MPHFQKQRGFKSPFASIQPAIAMTEPEAGTALTDLQTTTVKKDGHYLINGTKHWITGGGTTQAQLNMVARSIFKRKFDLRK